MGVMINVGESVPLETSCVQACNPRCTQPSGQGQPKIGFRMLESRCEDTAMID